MKRARLLAFVITAAMATTVFLGGTVARYQTSANIDDTATVAKWGVKLTMAGNLFDKKYTNGDANISKPTTSTTATDISVEASGTNDVVAPGTSGENFKISLTGTTEVDVAITASYDASLQDIYLAKGTYAIVQKVGTLSDTEYNAMMAASSKNYEKLWVENAGNYDVATGWTPSTEYYVLQNWVSFETGSDVDYYPIVYTYSLDNTKVRLSEVVTDLTNKLSAHSDIHANTPLVDLGYSNVIISWSWASSNDEVISNKDTVLGALSNGTTVIKLANGNDDVTSGTTLTVTSGYVYASGAKVGSVKTSLSIKITVEQKD